MRCQLAAPAAPLAPPVAPGVLVTDGALAGAVSLPGVWSARCAAPLCPGVPVAPAVLPITWLLAGFIVAGLPPSSARRHAPTPMHIAAIVAAAVAARAAGRIARLRVAAVGVAIVSSPSRR